MLPKISYMTKKVFVLFVFGKSDITNQTRALAISKELGYYCIKIIKLCALQLIHLLWFSKTSLVKVFFRRLEKRKTLFRFIIINVFIKIFEKLIFRKSLHLLRRNICYFSLRLSFVQVILWICQFPAIMHDILLGFNSSPSLGNYGVFL